MGLWALQGCLQSWRWLGGAGAMLQRELGWASTVRAYKEAYGPKAPRKGRSKRRMASWAPNHPCCPVLTGLRASAWGPTAGAGAAARVAPITAWHHPLHTPGELIWQRDTASEVRPVLHSCGGPQVLTKLVATTPSERVRLRALVNARRMCYEVGSADAMDNDAIVVSMPQRAAQSRQPWVPQHGRAQKLGMGKDP